MLALLLLGAIIGQGGVAKGAQTPAERSEPQSGATKFDRGHIVTIVIDDTKLLRSEDAAQTAAVLDLLDRELVAGRGPVGAISSGPGGVVLDLTYETSLLRPVIDKVKSGNLNFTGDSNDEMSSIARDATTTSIVEALGRLGSRRKVLAIIGRSTAASPERQSRLKEMTGKARDSLTRVLWFELQANECGRQSGLPTASGSSSRR